jgi:hypothetical protein
MKRLTLALGAAVIAIAASSSARADYDIVRWSYGDCKIWYISGPGPAGTGWKVLNRRPIKTWDAAWARLGGYQKRRWCT